MGRGCSATQVGQTVRIGRGGAVQRWRCCAVCALLEVAILVGLGAGCGGGWRRPLTRVTLQLYHFCVFEMHLNRKAVRMHGFVLTFRF
jgi:hypothetical protein